MERSRRGSIKVLIQSYFYSFRRVVPGLIAAARRAGNAADKKATTAIKTVADNIAGRSKGATP